MIKKGLHVGDVFEDCGRYFVVDKVLSDGYFVHRVDKEYKSTLEPESKPARRSIRKKSG